MENTWIEYKRSDKFLSSKSSDKKGWGKEIVAFANRNGGRIEIGKNDDGSFEGIRIFDKFKHGNKEGVDMLKQTIENYCKDNITPYIVCGIHHENHEQGELLVIEVPKREKYPFAIIEGVQRTYYIRTSHGAVPIMDNSLIAWLYNNTNEDHASRYSAIIYRHKNSFSFIIDDINRGVFNPPGFWCFVAFIQELNGINLSEENISKLLFFLFPYAILGSIANVNQTSWNTEIWKNKLVTKYYSQKEEYIKVKIVDIMKENMKIAITDDVFNEAISKLRGLQSSFMPEFCVPPETKVKIDQTEDYQSMITFSNPQFNIEINCLKSSWSAGLSGAPYYSSIVEAHGAKYQNDFFNKYSTQNFDIYINTSYDFPEDGIFEFEKIQSYCSSISRTIKEHWDSEYLYSNISLLDKVYSIDYKTRLIMEKLNVNNIYE